MIGNLISFAFMTACSLFTLQIIAKFIKYVVLFSKVCLAGLAAVIAFQFITLVPSSKFLNFLVFFAAFLVLIFLLGLLPRVNVSLNYIGNLLICTSVGIMGGQKLLAKIGLKHTLNVYFLLLIFAVCAVISFRVMKDQLKVEKDIKFLPLRVLDRLLGAAINTTALFFSILSTVNFPDNIPLLIIAVVISIAVFYILDLLLFHRISGYFTGRKMPSEIKNLLDPDRKKRKFGIFSFLGILDWFSPSDYDSGSNWAEEDRLRRERDLEEDYQAARREREAYEYQQRQIESANRYYDDNY